MNEERNRQEHLNHMKILFFIVARINGEYKRIDMNQEVINNDELCLHKQKRKSRD